MERKRVAILLPWLKMGGTNKIALNFITDLLDHCDVTLILSEDSGELKPLIPEGTRLIIDRMRSFRELVSEDLKHFRVKMLAKDASYYLNVRRGRDSIDNYKYIVDRTPRIEAPEFDCAISYHGQSPERLLNLLYRVDSRIKVVWIHGEMGFDRERLDQMKKYYGMVDHFFFVSNSTLDSFAKAIPFDPQKATVYYNPIDRKDILERSAESFSPAFSGEFRNILTVGRLSAEKGQIMIPDAAKKLLDEGFPVRWYIIGDGDMRPAIERRINELGLEDSVILLGTKTNPYCYMKACDVYVQPSLNEGYSATICEAGILGKAIVGTKPCGIFRDRILGETDCLIVDATADALADGIRSILSNDELKKRFEESILEKDLEGKGEIDKFLRIIYNDNAVCESKE